MKMKEKLMSIYKTIDEKSLLNFGFHIKDITFEKIINYMNNPKDSSSLAVTRILFGLAMVFDIPDERGGAFMDKRWSNPNACHFPLIPWIHVLPIPFMAVIYAALWIGAFGIMLGYKYRLTSSIFTICYWYLFLIEKSYWNNHSYLFGLVALLLSCTEANSYWSLDVYFQTTQKKTTVPYWNYFVLKYQFFILYFIAGVKKGTAEWLTGYSVQNLSEHWVFDPFKIFLTVSQINYLIVHWFIFLFDLTIAIWMMCSQTRHIAMIFCALFHLMNTRLFAIGMFPWVCLATMPLFYPFNWPHIVIDNIVIYYRNFNNFISTKYKGFSRDEGIHNEKNKSQLMYLKNNISKNLTEEIEKCNKTLDKLITGKNIDGKTKEAENVKYDKEIVGEDLSDFDIKKTDSNSSIVGNEYKNKRVTVYLIIFYIFIQAFLPFSHFMTKGYNNWTNGLYGYSWDMMVHTWSVQSAVVKIVDNENNKEFFIDPYEYAPNDRWTRHSDMAHQYARCLENNILKETENLKFNSKRLISKNISVYVDVWCSMNSRFVQRVFNPKVDLIKASWSPFENSPYLMPLLDEALGWRTILDAKRKDVHSWSNYSDVVFFADFPGYFQEKYIPEELNNVTVTVLEGEIAYQPEIHHNSNRQSYRLTSGDRLKIDSGLLHKILNIGGKPAFYMYTFNNDTEINTNTFKVKPKLPILKELYRRLRGMVIFLKLVISYALEIIFYFCGC